MIVYLLAVGSNHPVWLVAFSGVPNKKIRLELNATPASQRINAIAD
jgi:hypothetical protein